MGLGISKIYFEKGIPPLEAIKHQFRQQTGLELQLSTSLNLIELPSNTREVVEKISSDLDKLETLGSKAYKGNWEAMRKDAQGINYLSFPTFSALQFDEIEFEIKENVIQLSYLIGRFYFPKSLQKTLFDLGGRFLDLNDKLDSHWQAPKTWKKLKHWSAYKWYNRPKQ